MCGIVGYSGKRNAVSLIMDGLRCLEYRGYDSSGIAVCGGGQILIRRAEGKLVNLEARLGELGSGFTCGIGHTRWATHGLPEERNAHPHCAYDGSLAIVHNGIIENFREIREELQKEGIRFTSDTDTEALAHLIARERRFAGTLEDAFRSALSKAKGAYSVVMLSPEEPGVLYGGRRSAPLLLGIGDGECFLASDVSAFLESSRRVVYLNDGEIARVHEGEWRVSDMNAGSEVHKSEEFVSWDAGAARKNGYKHYMLKEIFEQPDVVANCLAGRIAEGPEGRKISLPELDALPVPRRLHIVACGTSYHAGLWAQQLLENIGGVAVDLTYASEFRYRDPILGPEEMTLVISQSGETADTLAAMRLASEKGCKVIGLCNVVGSSVAREADAVLYTQAGPEISVASTKAMCSQMLLLLLMAVYYGGRNGLGGRPGLLDEVLELPGVMRSVLPGLHERAGEIARSYSDASSFYFLGRGLSYALALEGALKLKEISYIHAEGYAFGEMKHGPIALIEPAFPSFVMAFDDELFPKVQSNIMEIRARRGKVIAIVQEREGEVPDLDADEMWPIPAGHPVCASFIALSAMQLFSYCMAVELGKDVDQPRNLAKSVTVE